MDFILNRLTNDLELSEAVEHAHVTTSRARMEYILYLCLGFVWKNFDRIPAEKQKDILSKMEHMTIGSVAAAVESLDIDHELNVAVLKEYPRVRNEKIGHGFSLSEEIVQDLDGIYQRMLAKNAFLREDCDIIVILRFNAASGWYEGVRFPAGMNGYGKRVSFSREDIPEGETEFPRTYVEYRNKYRKISPFVFYDMDKRMPYIFKCVEEKLLGKVRMCAAFPGMPEDSKFFKELIWMGREEEHRQISANGTIMTRFETNYKEYVDVALRKVIDKNFLKNQANVSATIWGRGGVGKTACVQKLCYDLFSDSKKRFSYIVFVTAKERAYNTVTGEIDSIAGNVTLYAEVIEAVAKVVFDSDVSLTEDPALLAEYEGRISGFRDTLLIVIDDYETFCEEEQAKISAFLKTLNAQYHKVIITTRNSRFYLGERYTCDELKIAPMKDFIQALVDALYSYHSNDIRKLLTNDEIAEKIHKATSGRPIFIYQFVHRFLRRGYDPEFLEGIRTSPNAREFLYGRIFAYLSKPAQYIFATISELADSELRFHTDVLHHVLQDVIISRDAFEEGLKELEEQKVLEESSDVIRRVYSEDLREIMASKYLDYSPSFRENVRSLLRELGGSTIKGSIPDALLERAGLSRKTEDVETVVANYRKVMSHSEVSHHTRKTALKQMVNYLGEKNGDEYAVTVLEAHLPEFPDDVDLYLYYIRRFLWSGNVEDEERRSKAAQTVVRFFAEPNHKKTDPENIELFAEGTWMCIEHILRTKAYPEDSRRNRMIELYNDYGRVFADCVRENPVRDGRALMSMRCVRSALLRILELCVELGEDERKKMYGRELCRWMRSGGCDEYTRNKIALMEENLQQRVYEIGEVVEVKISRLKPQCVEVTIENCTRGRIHISRIAKRYISNIYKEFTVGEICCATIVEIRKDGGLELSTLDFRS